MGRGAGILYGDSAQRARVDKDTNTLHQGVTHNTETKMATEIHTDINTDQETRVHSEVE